MTGPELRDIRIRKGYSLSTLAQATGVDRSTVARYQSGARKIPAPFAKLVHRLATRKK